MKRRRIIVVFFIIFIMAISAIVYNEIRPVTIKDFTKEELDSSVYDVEKYTTPFWEGNIVYNEYVFPLMNKDGELEPFQLMYDASEIVAVRNYTLETEYVEGIDYILEDGNLIILPTGSIRFRGYDYIYRDERVEDKVINDIYPFYPVCDGTGYIYWSEESELCQNALAVTYIHNDKWDYSIPKSQTGKLNNTLSKLENNEELTIVIDGDSISCGSNSSKKYGIPPYADGYVDMVRRKLELQYNNYNINIVNAAVGGTTAIDNLSTIEESIISHDPDLVIIAFGMNDASQGISTESFRETINKKINAITKELPQSEILLVTSLYGNPIVFSSELYEEHAKVLYQLSDEHDNVAISDPQVIMKGLLEKKSYISIMEDNMVHPNDFGMRIIAQCVIAALSE